MSEEGKRTRNARPYEVLEMTIKEAVDNCRAKQPSQFADKQLIAWLSVLDGQLFEYLKKHEKMTEREKAFDGYTEATPGDTVLLAETPCDDIYGYYLSMKLDYMLDEIDRYNVSASLFNEAEARYKRHIIQTRRPKRAAKVNYRLL